MMRFLSKDVTKLSFEVGGKGRAAAKFIRVAVHDMALYLLAWVKLEQYLGNPILWRLLAGTVSPVNVVFLSVGLAMRFNAQNHILKEQFAESKQQQNHSPDRIRIQVEDNGIGIAPENLTRISQLGFTNKKSGYGYGLHSDGIELGATVTLDLPCRPGEER